MKNDKSLPILLSHLCEWRLFEKFLTLTGVVGSLQDCLAFKKINLTNNFEAVLHVSYESQNDPGIEVFPGNFLNKIYIEIVLAFSNSLSYLILEMFVL